MSRNYSRFLLIFILFMLSSCIHISFPGEPAATIAVPRIESSGQNDTAVNTPSAHFNPPASNSTPLPAQQAAPDSTILPPVEPAAPATVVPISGQSNLPTYQLNVNISPEQALAQVEQTTTVTNHSDSPWKEIVFHMAQAYWPDVLYMEPITLTIGEQSQIIEPTFNNTMLTLSLSQPLNPGQQANVNFSYNLNLPDLDPYGWGPTGNTGWSPTIIQMGDWYPSLVPYTDNKWQTWDFVPVGDPVFNQLANFDITINVPPTHHVAAPGKITQQGTSHLFQLNNARAFAFLTGADYKIYSANVENIPVTVYVTSDHQYFGQVVLNTAVQAIDFLTELYGPYPYGELVIAENGFLTAMEYSALISLSGFAFDTYDGSAATLLEAITVHEVAHQWWYGAVGNDQINEPWIDEGMAMMAELLYYETYHSELVDWWWNFRVQQWNPTGPVDVTIYTYPDSRTFVHNMYGQVAYLMDELRDTMGEEAFRQFILDFMAENRDGIVTGEAFFNTAQQYSEETDLQTIRNRYFATEN